MNNNKKYLTIILRNNLNNNVKSFRAKRHMPLLPTVLLIIIK